MNLFCLSLLKLFTHKKYSDMKTIYYYLILITNIILFGLVIVITHYNKTELPIITTNQIWLEGDKEYAISKDVIEVTKDSVIFKTNNGDVFTYSKEDFVINSSCWEKQITVDTKENFVDAINEQLKTGRFEMR